eukprot:UN01078
MNIDSSDDDDILNDDKNKKLNINIKSNKIKIEPSDHPTQKLYIFFSQ